jgi:hypothetical protein
MLTAVPSDVLILIFDFGGSRILSHTCGHTWNTLQRRNAHYHFNVRNAAVIVKALQEPRIPLSQDLDAVVLQVEQFRNVSKHLQCRLHRHLKSLKDVPLFYTVFLDIRCFKWNKSSAECIKVLNNNTPMRITSLNVLADRRRSGEGLPLHSKVQALVELKVMTSLHTLSLVLSNNFIGDSDCQALASLKDAPCLHTLSLGLCNNDVGDHGCLDLAELKHAACLRILNIDLMGNNVGDSGAADLVGLRDAVRLNTLSLKLSHNLITDAGASALYSLNNAVNLHTLRVVITGLLHLERPISCDAKESTCSQAVAYRTRLRR